MGREIADQDDLLSKFRDWISIEVAQGDASQNTQRSYLGSVRGYLAWCRDRIIEITKVSENEVKLYRAHLIQSGYKRGTIETKLAGIRRFHDALQDWNIRLDNPAAKVKAKKDLTSRAEKIAEKYIPDREAFLNLWNVPDRKVTKGVRDSAILRVLCFTGIRVSELCALDLADIKNSDNPQLLIRGGKGRKRRHVPLGGVELEVLQEWIEVRECLASESSQALFIALDHRTGGRRLGPRGARSIVDNYLRQVGLKQPGRSCHALRHSLATWLLEAGVPTEAIADLLGHSSIAITAVYAKVVDMNKYTPSEIFHKVDISAGY
jgi:site-specific recombinase XerD